MTIVFLTQRLPYAPNRGDRLRAYHELRALAAAGHDVHVVSLVHDADEASHAGDLAGIAASVEVAPVPRLRNTWGAIPRLLGARPLTHLLLDSAGMGPALRRVAARAAPGLVLAFCSSMARFALEPPLKDVPCILDMVDVDSAKWAVLSGRAGFPMNRIYAREARLLGAFETVAARRAVVTYVVNRREADALRELAGPGATVEALENGVDVGAMAPAAPPQPSSDVVFCGVMDYGPNEEGALWLARSVWPAVRAVRPDARLVLVGASPTARLRALGQFDRSVVVTGSVPDVRPYLWSGAVSAAPLLVARGVQNKVLEAVASGLPAVVTPVVAEGLPPEVMPACEVANAPQEFAAALVRRLGLPPAERRAVARLARLDGIGWDRRLRPLLERVASLAE